LQRSAQAVAKFSSGKSDQIDLRNLPFDAAPRPLKSGQIGARQKLILQVASIRSPLFGLSSEK
jgi:hypothetical protein